MRIIVLSNNEKAKKQFRGLSLPDIDTTFVSYPLELETKLAQERFDLYILLTEELNMSECFYTAKVFGGNIPVLVVADILTLLSYSLYVHTCEIERFFDNARAEIEKAIS